MLRRLRFKFVCINMAIVTIMLGVIFGTVLFFTHENLEQQSIQMMSALAVSPGRPSPPGSPAQQMQLPYFVLRLDSSGRLQDTSGGYYDLSDKAFLDKLVVIAANSDKPIVNFGARGPFARSFRSTVTDN